jgi:hypothetical protein
MHGEASHRRPANWLLAAAILMLACGRPAGRATIDAAEAAAAAVRLAQVDGTHLPLLTDAAVRVLVTSSGVDVDDVPLVAAWPAPLRAKVRAELPAEDAEWFLFRHPRLIRLRDFQFDETIDTTLAVPNLPALEQVLAYAYRLESSAQRASGAGHRTEFPASIYVAADTPFRVAAAVLRATCGSGHVPQLVAQRNVAMVVFPTFDAQESLGAPHPNTRFGWLSLRLSRAGVTVTLNAEWFKPRQSTRAPRAVRSAPGLGPDPALKPLRPHNCAVTFPDRVCPPVGWSDSRLQAERLTRLLRELSRSLGLTDEQRTVQVRVEPDIPWRDVAATLDAASNAGFGLVEYVDVCPCTTRDFDRMDQGDGCDASVTPAELSPEDLESGMWDAR